MATKLKKLKLTSVDLVKRGANQDADICLYKSDTEPQEDEPTPGMMRAFFQKCADFFKTADEDVEKEAKSFDNITCGRKKRETVWKYTEALNESFMSAMNEEDMSDQEKKAFMQESLAQFTEAMGKLINDFSDVEPDIKVEMTKAAPEEGQPDSENISQQKEGVKKTMKFNTSNMTQEEALAFEQLLAKAEPMPEEEGKEEEKEASCKTKKVDKSDNQESEILKSAMERLEILEKGIELNKYKEIAKRYEVLGEKEEELANTLYSLAKSDEANYNAYIAVLDKSLDVVNKSGIFKEIGKSGNGTGSEPNTTTGKIEKAAQEIMKADPQISREEAMIKAWDENPDLIREYETEYKGN